MRTHPLAVLWLVACIACTARGQSPAPAASSALTPATAPTLAPQAATPGMGIQAPPARSRLDNVDEQALQTEDERNTIAVFQQAAASTVFVTQKKVVLDYYRGTAMEVPAGSGSGFIWDRQGHVVTNYHVVQGAERLSVTLHNQETHEATVVGTERRKDIAVLRLQDPPPDLVPIVVHGKGPPLVVGQKTIAIGNPFGLDQTLTTGVISALGREVPGIGDVRIRDMVQTDAAINPGNSGGPLLDSSGRLIGMNTMIFSRSGSSAGIGFAVPASSIQRVVPQIIRTGKAEQVGLGVEIDPAGRLERRFKLKGVVVLRVMANTPAARAGLVGIQRVGRSLRLGDIIIAINGERITDYDDLYNELDRLQAGSKARITLLREQQELNVDLELILLP